MCAMEIPRLPVIELQPSLRLTLVLAVAHAVVITLLALLPLMPALQITVGMLLLFNALHVVRRHALRRDSASIVALDFTDRERLRVRSRDGHWQQGRILDTSLVSAALVILNIRLDARRLPVHVVIAGDSADREALRRLRVWLRWGPRKPADAALSP